jgi:hypothetical protein
VVRSAIPWLSAYLVATRFGFGLLESQYFIKCEAVRDERCRQENKE